MHRAPTPPPSSSALIPISHSPSQWQLVWVGNRSTTMTGAQGGGGGDNNNKVVLFNPDENSLTVRSAWEEEKDGEEEEEEEEMEVIGDGVTTPDDDAPPLGVGVGVGGAGGNKNVCPLCRRPTTPIPTTRTTTTNRRGGARRNRLPAVKDTSYFDLLSRTSSANPTRQPVQPPPLASEETTPPIEPGLDQTSLNTGYYATFFEEVELLGKGGAGSVHLVRHVLNGEGLGLYACKKIAVGDSSASLLRNLREVHLLEAVHHSNIITYHHAWVESLQLSPFSPSVPTLFILQEWAKGGSLDSFISDRCGGGVGEGGEGVKEVKEKHKRRKGLAVHLLRIDEILDLVEDVTNGLGFLHTKLGILHLDIKAENVLLQWDDDALLPRAKLSDFGNATSDRWRRERTGGSGTLAYTSPESWDTDSKTGKLRTPDRATDLWALGLILHLLCFFTLPYHNEDDMRLLETEIQSYPGFFPKDALSLDHGTRHDVPSDLLRLIARLVHRKPSTRPSAEVVILGIHAIRAELLKASDSPAEGTALVRSPSPRRTSEPLEDCRILPLRPRASTGLLKPPPSNITTLLAPPSSPSSLDPRRAATRQRTQLLAGSLAIIKLFILERHEPVPRWAMYALFLSSLMDVAVADVRVTVLLGVSFVVLAGGVGGRML